MKRHFTVLILFFVLSVALFMSACSSAADNSVALDESSSVAAAAERDAEASAIVADKELPNREERNMRARTKASTTREDQSKTYGRNHLAEIGTPLEMMHGLPNNTLSEIEVDGDVSGATATAMVEPYGYSGEMIDGNPSQVVVRVRSWVSSNNKVQAMDISGRNLVLSFDNPLDAQELSVGGQFKLDLLVNQQGNICTFSINAIK